MTKGERNADNRRGETISIQGARCAIGPTQSIFAALSIVDGRVARIAQNQEAIGPGGIDLSGFLIMPGLVNPHDHLDSALLPRLAVPPHRNYIEWGEEIHRRFSDIITKHREVPKEIQVLWGGLRNLLCGVTTVCHHNSLLPEMLRDEFPVRVVKHYGWGHSLALGGDLRAARAIVPRGQPFLVHACEGIDGQARSELAALDRLGLLDASTVIVHGLAMDEKCVALMCKRDSSLVLCPSSNQFLFHKLPDFSSLARIERIAIGTDSPLTAAGDLLDEVRLATGQCKIPQHLAYRMVTTAPASMLRLKHFEGSLKESGAGDLFAIRDDGRPIAERIGSLSAEDVELVIIAGRVQLAAESILGKLPSACRRGLEPILIGSAVRWVRVPVHDLLRKTEQVLGRRSVRLGHCSISAPTIEVEHAC